MKQESPKAQTQNTAGCRNRGPGPTAYTLPTTVGYKGHDFSRHRNPAYSIRLPCVMPVKDISPGPKYGLAQNLTRYGPNGIPKYTIRINPKPLVPFNTPGPGTYDIVEKRRPGITIGTKPPPRKVTEVPAPNTYNMPKTFTRGVRHPIYKEVPAYTIAGYGGFCRQRQTPGPAEYSLGSTNTSPRFTIGLPLPPLRNKYPSPGPAAHFPQIESNSPKFSFGVKHTDCLTPLVLPQDVC